MRYLMQAEMAITLGCSACIVFPTTGCLLHFHLTHSTCQPCRRTEPHLPFASILSIMHSIVFGWHKSCPRS